MRWLAARMLSAVFVSLLGVAAAGAQPFGGWLALDGNDANYIEVPANEALNPTEGFTFEAWVRIPDPDSCVSFAGKDYWEAWWVGVCEGHFRSYLRGVGSRFDTPPLPAGLWTHIAVVWDGVNRYHYVDGVEAGRRAEGPPTKSSAPLRIGSDVSWEQTPVAELDEVSLWNLPRNPSQIAEDMAKPITGPLPGLLAVWSFDGNLRDGVAVYNGEPNNLTTLFLPGPPAGSWLTTPELPGFRFKVRITAGSVITGVKESDCMAETLCVSGAIPGRTEVEVRIIGPRPNGYLWPNLVKFTTSQVEVWIEQIGSGAIKYYLLPGPWPGVDDLPGLYDRTGFLP